MWWGRERVGNGKQLRFGIMGWRQRRKAFVLLITTTLFLVPQCARGSAETDLAIFNVDTLVSMESALASKVRDLEKTIGETRTQVDSMSVEIAGLRAQEDSQIQMRQNSARQKETLQEMQEMIGNKTRQRDEETRSVTELRSQVNTLEEVLNTLEAEKEKVKEVYSNPSLTDVLDKKAEEWSPVPKTLYTKTMRTILPPFWSLSSEVRSYQKSIVHRSRALGLLAALLMYGFNVASIIVCFHVYRRLRGRLTVPRLIVIGDTFCCGFWLLTLVCYIFLWTDPLYIIKQRNQTLFFFGQLLSATLYLVYVFLRVIVLAEKLSLGPFGELASVIVVGHHFYVRVWQPALTDSPFYGSFFQYFCYAWLFSTCAYRRIQEFSPLKQLQGPQLGMLTWLRVVYKRFTISRIPEGDLLPQSSRSGRFNDSDDSSSSSDDSDSSRDD